MIGRARTSLEYRSGAEVEDDLAAVLTTMQRAVDNGHIAVAKTFFRQGDAVTWANQNALGATV